MTYKQLSSIIKIAATSSDFFISGIITVKDALTNIHKKCEHTIYAFCDNPFITMEPLTQCACINKK